MHCLNVANQITLHKLRKHSLIVLGDFGRKCCLQQFLSSCIAESKQLLLKTRSVQVGKCPFTDSFKMYFLFLSSSRSHSRSNSRSGQGQGQGQDMVRSWSGHGQVRSNSNSNSNSKVGPELNTKIGFHHPPPTHHHPPHHL